MLCKYEVLALTGLGPVQSSRFRFHWLGLWFHEDINNWDTFWGGKDEGLARAELASFPHLHPTTHQPELSQENKDTASSWYGYIPLEAPPGFVQQNSFQCV